VKEIVVKVDTSTQRPRPKITISKETTHVTESLRPDGYVDYIAAINHECCEGVTPANNAALSFCRAYGPKSIDSTTRQRFFEWLGTAELPEEGPHLVAFDDFLQQDYGLKPSPSGVSGDASLLEEEMSRFDRAQRGPWSREEFPAVAALLEKNREPLQLFVEGARRPRYFVPLLGREDGAFVATEFGTLVAAFRDAARQLCARAMYRLGQGQFSDAWDDALTCHRLARLAGQGPLIVDALVSCSLEALATSCSVAVIQRTDVSAEQVRQWQSALSSLPPNRAIGHYWDHAERLFGLAEIASMALYGCPDPFPLDIDPGDPLVRELQEYVGQGTAEMKVRRLFGDDPRMDWNEALRYSNRCYDRLAAAFAEPTRLQQEQAIGRLVDEARERYQRTMKQAAQGRRLLADLTPETIARQFVDLFGGSWSITALATLTAAYQRDVYSGFTALALVLAAYLHDHGSYPAALVDLCPNDVADVPKDPFSDGEFRYRREEDGYLLYSVGPNGKDDGGRNFMRDTQDWSSYETATEEEQSWDDIAIRTSRRVNDKK
jgi:hypothetical protein